MVGLARRTVTARLMLFPVGAVGSTGTATVRQVRVVGAPSGQVDAVATAGGAGTVVGAAVVGAAVVGAAVAAAIVGAAVVGAVVVAAPLGGGVAPAAVVVAAGVLVAGGVEEAVLELQLVRARVMTTPMVDVIDLQCIGVLRSGGRCPQPGSQRFQIEFKPSTGGLAGHGGIVEVLDESIIDLAGTAGQASGAGGGGGGGLLSDVLFRHSKQGEGREGRGCSDGVDGQGGNPSSFGDPDSEFFIEAHVGTGGPAGSGARRPSDALAISALTLANSVEIRQDLLYVLGGAWQNYEVLNLGDPLRLCVVVVSEAGALDPGEYTAAVSVEDPAGHLASSVSSPSPSRSRATCYGFPEW